MRITNDDIYCYPETEVLKNKYGITDQFLLDKIQSIDILNREIEIMQNPIKGNYDLIHYQKIHKYLFQDVFEWAGELRMLDIYKGHMFTPHMKIIEYANSIFTNINKKNNFKNLDIGTFINELAISIGDVYALHPFREGNSRSRRIFFKFLAKDAGYNLRWEKLDSKELFDATVLSMHQTLIPLKTLLALAIEKI